MRRPSPDLTTACATRKAITTSSTLGLANPANAFAAEIVPVRTTAAEANIVEVRSGRAPSSTAVIAATNTAKRCHAGAVSPAGSGANQMPIAKANGKARLSHKPALLMTAPPSERRVHQSQNLHAPCLSDQRIRLANSHLRSRAEISRRIRTFLWLLSSAPCLQRKFRQSYWP